MGQALNKYGDDVQKEFAKVVRATNGKGNNQTIYNLIKSFNCTADDLMGVANKTDNTHFETQNYWVHDEYWLRRRLNEYVYNNYRTRDGKLLDKLWVKLSDYKWYLKYIPDDCLDGLIIDRRDIKTLFEKDKSTRKELTDSVKDIYVTNKCASLLYKENYPSDFFADRFKKNQDKVNAMLTPYTMKEVSLSRYGFEHKNRTAGFYNSDFSIYGKGAHSTIHRNTKYDRDIKDYGYESQTVRDQLLICDLYAQIKVLTDVMANECEPIDGITDKETTYGDYFLCNDSRKPTGNRFHPSRTRLELFGQVKALEMLLAMGIGVQVRDGRKNDWGFYESNKKFNKRIQTAYKSFVRCKTVDDRKNLRELVLSQLNIISCDFMHASFVPCKLKCVKEQDEAFENGTVATVARKISTATGAPKGKVFDLAKLAQAPTKNVKDTNGSTRL